MRRINHEPSQFLYKPGGCPWQMVRSKCDRRAFPGVGDPLETNEEDFTFTRIGNSQHVDV